MSCEAASNIDSLVDRRQCLLSAVQLAQDLREVEGAGEVEPDGGVGGAGQPAVDRNCLLGNLEHPLPVLVLVVGLSRATDPCH